MDEICRDAMIGACFEGSVPSLRNADELGHFATCEAGNPTALRASKADILRPETRTTKNQKRPQI